MSNNTKLPDREYKQYKTPWPWIHSTSFLQLFFRFDCCRVEQCNDSCDKENVIGFVAKKFESIAVESGFLWSQCWIGGSTHLHNPPYFSICVTAWGQFTDEHTSLVTGVVFVCVLILRVLILSVDRFLAVYLHLRYQEIVNPTRVVSILILSWVISTIFSLSGIVQEYHDFLRTFVNVFLATCLIHNNSITLM